MKKSLLAILFCMTFTAMFAQQSNDAKAIAATDRMAKTLDLNDEQKQKIRAAYLEVFIQTSELGKGEKSTRPAKQNAIQSKFDTDLAQVLTPEQSRKWNSQRNHKPSPGIGKNDRLVKQSNVSPKDRILSSSNRSADRMAKQLELSDSQRDQVFEAHKKKLTEVQTLRDNKTDRSQMIQAKKRINKDYQTTVDNILTTGQIEQRESIRAKRIQRTNNKLEKGPGKKMEVDKNRPSRIDKETDVRMEDQVAHYTERMTKKLSLTKDQIDPFQNAFLKRISSLKKGKQRVKRSEAETGRKEIMEAYRADLEKFLTPDQLKTFDEMKQNKKRTKKG